MDKIVDKDRRKAEWTAVLIFTLDEIFEMVGYPTINNEFSKKRLFTKNFAEEGESNE